MHLHVYVLAKGEDSDDAESNVRCFIEDQVGEGKLFDYGGLDETPGAKTFLLYTVRKKLQKSLEKVYNVTLLKYLEMFDKDLKKIKSGNKPLFESNTTSIGFPSSHIANICYQEFCEEMPFFNREECSWLLPGENEDGVDEDGLAWYAVPVDLHC